MDVLNKGNEFFAMKTQLLDGAVGLVLGFKQSENQKNHRGIVVICPDAAREYAKALLVFADETQPQGKTINVTPAKPKQIEAPVKKPVKKKSVKKKTTRKKK